MSATDYETAKSFIDDAIHYLAKWHRAASEYLKAHVVFDETARTWAYTGDDRIELTRSPYPPFGMAFRVGKAEHIRVLKNEYGNPITVGKVYAVLAWRKIGRRKGLFPRILDDTERPITMDRTTHYETVYMDKEPAP